MATPGTHRGGTDHADVRFTPDEEQVLRLAAEGNQPAALPSILDRQGSTAPILATPAQPTALPATLVPKLGVASGP